MLSSVVPQAAYGFSMGLLMGKQRESLLWDWGQEGGG